ncbi:hypothetical protein DVA44_13080 [Leclercia sp. W17]|nr:hypothetical protein DVA44_13080 [Leclercia sp. W17]
MFYNSKRRHGSSVQMSPTEYETSIISGSEVSRLPVAIQVAASAPVRLLAFNAI